jgi:hypothetical protein
MGMLLCVAISPTITLMKESSHKDNNSKINRIFKCSFRKLLL